MSVNVAEYLLGLAAALEWQAQALRGLAVDLTAADMASLAAARTLAGCAHASTIPVGAGRICLGCGAETHSPETGAPFPAPGVADGGH